MAQDLSSSSSRHTIVSVDVAAKPACRATLSYSGKVRIFKTASAVAPGTACSLKKITGCRLELSNSKDCLKVEEKNWNM